MGKSMRQFASAYALAHPEVGRPAEPEAVPSRTSEHAIQSAFVAYLRTQCPELVFFSIPNDGKRTYKAAAWMRSQGLTAGIPDLFIAQPVGRFGGLFLEFKAAHGVVSKAQKDAMLALLRAGYGVSVVKTVPEAVLALNDYFAVAQVRP